MNKIEKVMTNIIENKRYKRTCDRCLCIYQTSAKMSHVCQNCNKAFGGTKWLKKNNYSIIQ